MRNLSILLTLFFFSSAVLSAGKPTPQPTYVWKVVLVDGGDISGGDDLTRVDNLATAVGCSSTSDPLCTELNGKAGWVFGPADATVRNVVTDNGAMFYPGFPQEALFSMLLSASASHKHVKFGTLTGLDLPDRLIHTQVNRNVTTTYQSADFCFLNFLDPPSDPNFVECVINRFLAVGQHPAPGYAEVRFSFIGPRSLMDAPPTDTYSPATFTFGTAYSPSDSSAPCSAQKANIGGIDYPNEYPTTYYEPALPAGTFIRRVTTDSWKVEIRADFSNSNPFPANPKPDTVTAGCYVCSDKFTTDVYQNLGKLKINSTVYFIRTMVN